MLFRIQEKASVGACADGSGMLQFGAMKSCAACTQENPDEATFCQQCGEAFSGAAPASDAAMEDARLWREFIGPNADRYFEQFRKFITPTGPRYALTWHWPAFLVDPFLWFLYRKMYLYAAVYAVGPVVSAYLTQDLMVGVVWRFMAGVSANYIYYWHVKEHLTSVRGRAADSPPRDTMLRDLGGVQPYVIWLGVALHLLLMAFVIEAIREGLPGDGKNPFSPKSKPAPTRTRL